MKREADDDARHRHADSGPHRADESRDRGDGGPHHGTTSADR